jgi:RHS repeat-associated protein
MRRLLHFAVFFAGVATASAWIGVAAADGQRAGASELQGLITAAHFEEPLVRMTQTSAAEDVALSETLLKRQAGGGPKVLQAYARDYPRSGWTPAIELNLGLSALRAGYFTEALSAFESAWTVGRDATDPQARLVVDLAVGRLARLEASLGKNDDLRQLFRDIGSRPIAGSATEDIQTAREEFELSTKDPRHLYLCGPLALEALLLEQGATPQEVDFLNWYEASPSGTNLAELGHLADKASFDHKLVFRTPGQPVPVPSVVNWKVGHFAAIVGEENGVFHVKDPVFPNQDLWVDQGAIDAESSGYFLVPAATVVAEWHPVDDQQAASIWGRGPTSGTPPGIGPSLDPQAGSAGSSSGSGPLLDFPQSKPDCLPCAVRSGSGVVGGAMASASPAGGAPLTVYDIGESTVSLDLSDTPVGYSPPIGPAPKVQISYNQREDSQPAVFAFFNVGPKWTINWLSYVTDDPLHPGINVSRFLAGGGAYYYSGYNAATGLFTPQTNDGSILALASQSPVTYRHQLGDGSTEIYAQSDGATASPRHIFLSQILDPQGNALTLSYDGQMRLTSLTDATGRVTTFTYGITGHPLLVSKITDPFGRSAVLTYDGNYRLSSITDIIGLTSSFAYDANSLVNSLTTPYGTTSFAYTAPGTAAPPRYVQVTDPLGHSEREEWLEPAPVSASDPSGTVPQGMPVGTTNNYLQYRDSFHWDKLQYVSAACTPSGGCDYAKARVRHFEHDPTNGNKSNVIESEKYPLENRIWYNYPGQTDPIRTGTYNSPSAIGRVLDDGSTQLSLTSYDTAGFFKPTQVTDPLGRVTSLSYSGHIDLASVSQTGPFGVQQTVAQFIYNTRHRPVYYTNAAGETSVYAYNAAGQLLSETNALGQVTTYNYNGTGDLLTVTNADHAVQATYTYDAFDRIESYTDSEGWTVRVAYDAADRVTRLTYPDGTADLFTYDKLDPASYKDRDGRLWTYTFDAERRLTAITDPSEHQVLLRYDEAGNVTSLTDANSNVTQWAYDLESRPTVKTYADTSTTTSTYETTTSRLKSILDALGQTKTYGYARDNRLTSVSYTGAVNPTPNVTFAYDPFFPRLVSMTDGTGTTSYSYLPVGSPGGLAVAAEDGPLAADTIDYGYDALGRVVSRTVQGAGQESWAFDDIGRLVAHDSDLGNFTLSYLGETDQITERALTGSTLATSWSYLTNHDDRRLSEISNVGLSPSQYSTFHYVMTPEQLITSITQTSDASASYPPLGTQTASYNDLNQLALLNTQSLTYDANGNLLSDGQREYQWDAENRLISITYPEESGKKTEFAYDGLGRRTAITNTPAGGGTATTTLYTWCSSAICQARNPGNDPVREYFAEGEYLPGTSPQTYFYGIDQIGSVRRAFVDTSTAPAYDYDPYGVMMSGTASIADFGYAGMFGGTESGLYLTQFRAYDPSVGRWISRDPLEDHVPIDIPGVKSGPLTSTLDRHSRAEGLAIETNSNRYAYVGNVPLSYLDSSGLDRGAPLIAAPYAIIYTGGG